MTKNGNAEILKPALLWTGNCLLLSIAMGGELAARLLL
jgi:hypothetical protein